jgi:general secretion pathway protein D
MRFGKYIVSSMLALSLGMPAVVMAQATGTVRLPSPPATPTAAPTPVPPTEPITPTEAPVQPAIPEKPTEELVYLNVQDQDIKDVIKQISKATGKNFIIDDKVRGKVTIISEKMMTKEEAYQAFLSALEVAGFTVVTGPGGIIKVVALKDAISSPIPIHVDSTPYTDSFVTRLISLDNISATDMANAVKGLVSKSGNLFAYPATNTLIITDSGTNIDRLMKLIKELDQEGPQEVVEIIPVAYADASDVAQKVLQLFEIEKAQAARATIARRTRRGAAAATQLAEIKAVSKIIADDRTNSIIVLASTRAIDRVRSLIKKLDTPLDEGESGKVHVHYLKYANAPDLAATLSSLTSGAKAPTTAKGIKGKAAAKKPTVAHFEGGISIAADESTNALIITATARDYQTLVDELISKLDIPRRQVYLEAVVMELTMKKTGDYGVSGYGGGGSSSVLGFGQTFGAAATLFDPLSFFSQGGLLGGAFGRNTIQINVPTQGGTAQTMTIPTFAAFLNMLQVYADTNVVSTPNILTLDNEEAEITVKRKEYAESTTSTATGVISSTPTPLETGLTLKITPQISEGDVVRLKIAHELSNFEEKPQGAIASPERSRKINTTVMAADGQTVVLGGLMQDVVSHSKSKVPILGDIPIIGWLFRQQSSRTDKSNLLVFITPHVIRDPTDYTSVLKRKINQRNAFIADNFGKRQAESIRDVIRAHRADLLEYIPPPPPAPPVTPPTAVQPTTAKPIASSKGVSVPPPAPPSAPITPPPPPPYTPSGKKPVITVPSVDSSRGVVESSASKPIMRNQF